MKKFFNFIPTKAEEGNSSGQAVSSSDVDIRGMNPHALMSLIPNYMEADKWTITKVITASDIDKWYRLCLPQGGHQGRAVQDNILCYLHPEIAANVMAGRKEFIKMKDVDNETYVANMTITRDTNLNVYYIQGHWKSGFVRARNLQIGHHIGLRWNVEEHCLEFSKLN